jgi:hypothetical protein
VLLADDEAPAVSLSDVNACGASAFEQRSGNAILRRYDRRD